jgi:galactokinase
MAFDLEAALRRVYGDDARALAEQMARYRHGLQAFAAHYGGAGEVHIYRAPGRVNLIGEHTDYNHGYVLPMALDKDVLVYARPRADQVVNLVDIEPDFTPRGFGISRDIPLQPIGDWANYVQGAAQLLEREYGPGLHGFDALVAGAPPYGVPRGAGLSSSSALTVASAVALLGLNGVALEGATLAESCSRAEWYVGTRGGIMDHFISVLGQRDHALFLDCRPLAGGTGYAYKQVAMPAGYAVVVVDSGVRHQNTGPDFNRRVAEGRIGVRLLHARYPTMTHLRDVEHLPWGDLEPLLPEEIHSDALRKLGIDPDAILDRGVSPQTDTFRVRQRCRHVITENNRVLESTQALEAGDMPAFGQLMHAAHASARDDYEISIPEIEALVRLALAAPGTVGARLTGAGWGGCIVALVRTESVETFRAQVVRRYYEETGREAHVFVCRSAAGAGLVLRSSVNSIAERIERGPS